MILKKIEARKVPEVWDLAVFPWRKRIFEGYEKYGYVNEDGTVTLAIVETPTVVKRPATSISFWKASAVFNSSSRIHTDQVWPGYCPDLLRVIDKIPVQGILQS